MRIGLFYKVCKLIIKPSLIFLFGLRIIGKQHIPAKGGCIIYANHKSYLDPVAIGAMIDRPIYFMAKEELFHIPILRFIISHWGAFPVKRHTADMTAIRKALSLLKDGQVFGIFPEGTRSKTGRIAMLEPGIALIALKAGVPVIPVFVDKYKWFGGTRICVGQPLDLSKYDKSNADSRVLEEISDMMYRALVQLQV